MEPTQPILLKQARTTHEGAIPVGEKILTCAVLEDGTRVISAKSIFDAFGRIRKGKSKVYQRVAEMPSFLDAKNIQPFIDAPLLERTQLLSYTTKGGGKSTGYDARILPLICKVYLDARTAGVLTPSQVEQARASEILLLSLSTIGIIALVDEATGYQYERERDELQKILKAYISEALLPWQRQFPSIYYKEIFRLNGWDFSVSEITRRRPGVVGTWTNQYVYEQLPKDVLKTLKEKTPKNEAGKYKAKLHQSLTQDVGHPGLQNQISSVVALMEISDTWDGFKLQFEKLRQRRAGQLELKLPEKKVEKVEPKRVAKPRQKKLTLFDEPVAGPADNKAKQADSTPMDEVKPKRTTRKRTSDE